MASFLVVGAASVFGLLCGSFLNVCIARMPAGESVISPRSHCTACGRQLPWFENIPLLSFLALRGSCRGCGSRIGWRYPAVELATALWFALGAWPVSGTFPWSDTFFRLLIHQVSFCALGSLLIGLMVIDWLHQRLPDALTLPGMLLGFFLVFADAIFLGPNDYNLVLQRKVNITAAGSGRSTGNVFLTGPEHLIYGRLLAVVACFLLLFTIRTVYRVLRKRDGMGLGDAKLLAMIASFIGFAPAMLTFFIGTVLASAYGVAMVVRGRGTAVTRLPFGSFLAMGGLGVALAGAPVIEWYLSLFH